MISFRALATSPHVASPAHAEALAAQAEEAEQAEQATPFDADDEAAYQAARAAVLPTSRPCSLCLRGEGCDGAC